MSIKLTCPSCRSDVTAQATDQGTTVRCGICHAEVAVPAAPAKSVPYATAVPAAPVATAVPAAPVAARPATAVPAVARPATAAPAAARPAPKPSSRDDDDRPRGRSRRRDDDIEDDDEYYRDDKKKKGSNVILLLVILGGVMFVGFGVAAFALIRANRAANDAYTEYEYDGDEFNDDEEFPDEDPDLRPRTGRSNRFGRPDRTPPGDPGATAPQGSPPQAPETTAPAAPPPKPNWEKSWAPVPRADGFTALMPGPVASIPNAPVTVEGEPLRVWTYSAEEGGVKYTIQWFDVPEEFPDVDDYLARMRAKWRVESGARPATLGGTPATQSVYANSSTRDVETVRTAKVGPRIFLLTMSHNPDRLNQYPDLNLAAKQKQFFDSVQITVNPFAKAPMSAKVTAPDPATPGTTNSPTAVAPAPGTITPGPIPGASGGIVYVARIERFLTGLYLADRKEIWTFDMRNPGPAPVGVLRRYSAGSLKLIATTDLPGPVTHAAIDEPSGRLYAAVVTRNAGGFDYHERLSATAELHAYDVTALVAGAAAKPVAAAQPEGKITGLVAPRNAKVVYATTVLQPPAKKMKVRLLKFAAPKLTESPDFIDLPQSVAVLRMSPDGKRLAAAETPYNAFGNLVRGFNSPTQIHLVDAAAWKLAGAASVPGVATDVQFLDETRAVAVVSRGGQQVRLVAVDSKGATTDVTPASPGFRAPGVTFAAVIPESNRAVFSAGAGTGAEVFDLAAGARSLGHANVIPGLLINGPGVVADPEGKVVAFGSGAVLNVAAAK